MGDQSAANTPSVRVSPRLGHRFCRKGHFPLLFSPPIKPVILSHSDELPPLCPIPCPDGPTSTSLSGCSFFFCSPFLGIVLYLSCLDMRTHDRSSIITCVPLSFFLLIRILGCVDAMFPPVSSLQFWHFVSPQVQRPLRISSLSSVNSLLPSVPSSSTSLHWAARSRLLSNGSTSTQNN